MDTKSTLGKDKKWVGGREIEGGIKRGEALVKKWKMKAYKIWNKNRIFNHLRFFIKQPVSVKTDKCHGRHLCLPIALMSRFMAVLRHTKYLGIFSFPSTTSVMQQSLPFIFFLLVFVSTDATSDSQIISKGSQKGYAPSFGTLPRV